ncbi:hypothetical protein EG68_05762 [Paragonimus skrjabini miyazakii]|uniref:Uncharacterized protein n=1 Tax=Paragonimus skrjabini miyazakii TaxID=59628 RepID=A0A8S9YWC9_9TREM|nr:hypothetical protein EG68_05762 [Paragonimus skrjabini miyazakii]
MTTEVRTWWKEAWFNFQKVMQLDFERRNQHAVAHREKLLQLHQSVLQQITSRFFLNIHEKYSVSDVYDFLLYAEDLLLN